MKFRIKFADQIVGALSIIAIAALIFIVFFIGSKQKWFVKKHPFYTEVNSGSSLSEGMNIQYKGFGIGKLKKITLNDDDNVILHFYILDEYIDRITEGSIIEVSVSPIGLGSSLIFHPGNSKIIMEDDTLIPELNSKTAKQLIKDGKCSINVTNDSINTILGSATSLIQDVDVLIRQLNGVMSGDPEVTLTTTITEVNRILKNLANLTEEPQGLIPKLLEDDTSKGSIGNLLSTVNKTINDVNVLIASESPDVSILVMQLQVLMTQAQDVMEGLKNNPLLKNGISDRPEKESATPKLRDGNF